MPAGGFCSDNPPTPKKKSPCDTTILELLALTVYTFFFLFLQLLHDFKRTLFFQKRFFFKKKEKKTVLCLVKKKTALFDIYNSERIISAVANICYFNLVPCNAVQTLYVFHPLFLWHR